MEGPEIRERKILFAFIMSLRFSTLSSIPNALLPIQKTG